MRNQWIASVLCAFLAVFSACGGDSPALVAEKAMNAMVAGDIKGLEPYVCRDLADRARASLAMLKAIAGDGQGQFELADMQYKAGSQAGDTVPVTVTGIIRGRHPQYGEVQEEIHEVFQVVREDGQWKVCAGFL